MRIQIVTYFNLTLLFKIYQNFMGYLKPKYLLVFWGFFFANEHYIYNFVRQYLRIFQIKTIQFNQYMEGVIDTYLSPSY